MKKPPGKTFKPILLALGLCLLTGCATIRYQGPSNARSADFQTATSKALERALNKISYANYSGRKVWIEVFTLTQRFDGESPEERFVRNFMAEGFTKNSVTVAPTREGADLRLAVGVRAIGVSKTRRDFIPVYYSELTTGIADLHIAAHDLKTGSIAFTEDVSASADFRQVYWFYIFGPKTTVD